jgi:hypothetical protein
MRMTNVRIRYFHEDDYCQQEFLPLSSWDHCASQVMDIDAFSEAHRTEHGWTDLYIRSDAPHSVEELDIAASDIGAAVQSVLPPFAKVTTGYSSHVEDCPRVQAFGFEHGLTLFIEVGTRGCVSTLWLDPWGLAATEIDGVVGVLGALPRCSDLLFVDWACSRLFKASDRQAWVTYFDELSRT